MQIRNPKFLIVSSLCGGMGVLSGYAIFLTYQQVMTADPAEHARAHFFLALLITAIISYGIEWIRELIREGRIEHASHPIFRTMGTFIIVLMFELFVLGFHTTSDLSLGTLRSTSQQLMGSTPSDSSATLTLVLAAGLWIGVGALLAAWLSRSVKDSPGTTRQRIWSATRNGIIGGLIFAPVIMALYILCGRCLVALADVYQAYGGGYSASTFQNPLPILVHNLFLPQNEPIRQWLPKLITICFIFPFGILVDSAQQSLALFMIMYLAIAAFVVGYPMVRRSRFLKPLILQIFFGLIWLVALIYTLGPFAFALFFVVRQLAHKAPLETLGAIMLVAAAIWTVPGALLGALTPLLRRVSTHTRNWAFVGYGSAFLLIVATLWARAWLPLIPALAALAVGYMFQRGSSVREYWPFAALCVAAGICGATSITQHVTFASEALDLHAIDVLRPTPADQPAVAGFVKSYDQLSPTEKAQVDSSDYNNYVIIHADNGRTQLVPVWMFDKQRAIALWKQMEPASVALASTLNTPPPQPIMPTAADLPPGGLSPIIEAAVARANDPNAPPEPAPAPQKPHDDIATINDMMAQIDAMNPDNPAYAPNSHKSTKKKPATLQPALHQPAPHQPAPVTPICAPPTASLSAPSATTPTTADTTTAAAIPTASPATLASSNPTPIEDPAADKAKADKAAADTAAKIKATEDRDAKALELSIAGSVGFWVTVGLLACWSMQETTDEDTPTEHPTTTAA